MFTRKCKITFIAHGATIHSEENRISDKEKYPPLNDAGIKEIEKICDWLKRRAVKNDKIYADSSVRTLQSARMIADCFKDEVEIINGLSTRKFGVLSGLSLDDIEKKQPDILIQMYGDPASFCPDGGETLADFNKRVRKTIKRIVNENIGNRIIIVTHPDVIRSAVASAVGLPVKNQEKVYIRTGSATQISYFETWSSLVYSGCVPL